MVTEALRPAPAVVTIGVVTGRELARLSGVTIGSGDRTGQPGPRNCHHPWGVTCGVP